MFCLITTNKSNYRVNYRMIQSRDQSRDHQRIQKSLARNATKLSLKTMISWSITRMIMRGEGAHIRKVRLSMHLYVSDSDDGSGQDLVGLRRLGSLGPHISIISRAFHIIIFTPLTIATIWTPLLLYKCIMT